MLEVISAAHQTAYVASPFPQRGALMIVGPPGVMKTSMMETALLDYPNALVIGDINVKTLGSMRDDLTGGRYTTIAFTEFEKLYQRQGPTASNLEGHLKALIEEGFTKMSWEPSGMPSLKARSLVVGAMTYKFFATRYEGWCDSGFARRCLWCLVKLKNPQRIVQAIHDWELIPMESIVHKTPGNRSIPYSVTQEESRLLQKMIRDQRGEATPYVLLKKILCVLKWKFDKNKKEPMNILQDFAPCLSKEGTSIEL